MGNDGSHQEKWSRGPRSSRSRDARRREPPRAHGEAPWRQQWRGRRGSAGRVGGSVATRNMCFLGVPKFPGRPLLGSPRCAARPAEARSCGRSSSCPRSPRAQRRMATLRRPGSDRIARKTQKTAVRCPRGETRTAGHMHNCLGDTSPDDYLGGERRRKVDAASAMSTLRSDTATRPGGQRTTATQRAHEAHVSDCAAAAWRLSLLAGAHLQERSYGPSKGERAAPLVVGECGGTAAASVPKHTHAGNSKNTHMRVSTRRLEMHGASRVPL